MRATALAAAVAWLLAGPALADGPIATAPAAGPSAPQPTAPSPPLSSFGPGVPGGPPMAMGPCGLEKIKPNGSLETAPHGEVEGGVGTNGYREVGGAICQPVGQNGGFVAASGSYVQGDIGYRRH